MLKKFIKKILHFPRLITSQNRRLPDFIIIGVQKGGTTSLFHYLKLHPCVRMSSLKEVHFFDNNYSKGINWYKSYFPFKSYSKNKIVGEASPYYVFHPHALKRIKKTLPNVKIIVIFRDPIERAYSHYKMEFRKGKESHSFKEAISLESSRIDKEYVKLISDENYYSFNYQTYSYMKRGLYGKQLEDIYKYFNKEDVCVLQSVDLLNSPETTLKRVYDFLNIPAVLPSKYEIFNKGNSSKLDPSTVAYLSEYFKNDSELFKKLIKE